MTKSHIVNREGVTMSPLNVTDEDVSILDMIYALSYQPMNGGIGRQFYSKIEHICNMYDYFNGEEIKIITELGGANVDTILSMPNRELKIYLLMYYGGIAYLTGIIGTFEAWNHHNPRVLGSLLYSIGLDYKNYKIVEPIFEQIDHIIKKNYINSKFNKFEYGFLSPYNAMKRYIDIYNIYSDIKIYIVGKESFEIEHKDQNNCYVLPTIKW